MLGEPDKIDEAYRILEENFLIVPNHLKNLLKKLSVVGIRVWAHIQDSQFEKFEESIKGVLFDEKEYEAMNTEEKKSLFGENYWNKPKQFKFLPGELLIMSQMREVSKKLLEKKSHKNTVRGRDSKLNEAIPIITIDFDIKEEDEKPEISKLDENKATRKAPSDDCDSWSSPSDIQHTAAVSLSQKSNNPSVELKAGKGGSTTDWIAASDEWGSTTSTLIAAASQTEKNAGTLSTDDWCEKTNSQTTNSNEKEASSCVSKSTNDWDAFDPYASWRIAASDAWDSTTSTLIAAASQTEANAGTLSTDDCCEKTNSQSTNSNEKEASPCVSKSTNDWDACADAWASSSSKTPRNEVKAITNVDQSSWGATCKFPASSNSKTPSDDWDSWSTTSNSAAPKSNIVPISGGNDDWSTSADAWGASKGTNAGCNQSDGWGSTETVKSSWTSGYKASRDGRGSKRKKKVKEGHMSYNCPINPNRGRGGGRGSGRGRGTRTRVYHKCNEEGHMSYDCPTGPTRGRGGGRGGGSTRPCYKCNQEGHTSYNCPTASRGGIRSSPASGYGATNSSTSQPVFHDWGTLTATSGTRSSSYDSGDKKNDWGSSSGSVSSPWANDSNAAARGERITPRSSAPFRDGQPVVDDWGISSIPSTVPIIKPVSHTTTGNSGSDDWDAAADAWSAIDTTKSTPLSGNSSAVKVRGDDSGSTADSSSSIDSTKFTQLIGNSIDTTKSTLLTGNSNAAKVLGDNCDAVASIWDECPNSNSKRDSRIISNRPSAILKIDDWGISAEVRNSFSVSNDRATPRIPRIEDFNVSGLGGKNYASLSKYCHELIQSKLNPFVWNGTINHGRRCFTISMKNMDVNPPPVPADFEMPKSMRVMGTIEPEKVWTYLKRVKQTTNESIGVFEFSPATTTELDGYKFFFDELHGMNWFAVIADAPGSKLPSCFKDFYVVPLAKDGVVPLELTSLVNKSFVEHRTFDLLFGVVVLKSSRSLVKVGLNGLLSPIATVPVPQTVAKSDKIAVPNADGIPNVVTAVIERNKKDQILGVNPSEVSLPPLRRFDPSEVSLPPLRRFKIPLLRQHCLARSPTATTEDSAPIPVSQNISNPLKRPIEHPKKSMSRDSASTTPIEAGVPDLKKKCSSKSVQASFSNVEGPMTRSRVRINTVNHNQQKNIIVNKGTKNF